MRVYPLLSYKALRPNDMVWTRPQNTEIHRITVIQIVEEDGVFYGNDNSLNIYEGHISGDEALKHLIIHRRTQDGELEILAGEEAYFQLTGKLSPKKRSQPQK